MSDTNIEKTKQAERQSRRSERRRVRQAKRARAGGLTLRILAVNVIAPLVLVLGILYLGQYRDGLIKAELETLKIQASLFAGAIAEGGVRTADSAGRSFSGSSEAETVLLPDASRRMVRRLGQTTDTRTRLFNRQGNMIGDSHELSGPGGIVEITALEPPEGHTGLATALRYVGRRAVDLLPMKTDLQPYPEQMKATGTRLTVHDFPDTRRAYQGEDGATAWEDRNENIILSAAAPIENDESRLGVVLITRTGEEIETALSQVRFDVFTVFLGALSVTIFLSLYLAGVIGRPLKKLAVTAEAIRQGQGREIDIPDLSHRRDEIGELSMALRDMTQALWDRMDTIETFAADVAHEIKNPLTSLRSAVETASKIDDPADRDRLMEIIQHDVERLNRLISDISNASRLDAELSRDELEVVDVGRLLKQLTDAHRPPLDRGEGGVLSRELIRLELPPRDLVLVRGTEGRLAQVFENLIANALSFSPDNGQVTVRAVIDKDRVKVQVEDEGPGVPESKRDEIFERFYSERPSHEDYGAHSGLGLSIARQIVRAHKGEIRAENVKGKDGQIKGACFTVVLDAIV